MNDTIAQRKARGYERLVSERDAAIKRAEAAQAAIAQAVQDEREASSTPIGTSDTSTKIMSKSQEEMR